MDAYLVMTEDWSEIVFAETRGKAKAIFVNWTDGDWTDCMSIRLLKKAVNERVGVADVKHPLWKVNEWPFDAEVTEEGCIWIPARINRV